MKLYNLANNDQWDSEDCKWKWSVWSDLSVHAYKNLMRDDA